MSAVSPIEIKAQEVINYALEDAQKTTEIQGRNIPVLGPNDKEKNTLRDAMVNRVEGLNDELRNTFCDLTEDQMKGEDFKPVIKTIQKHYGNLVPPLTRPRSDGTLTLENTFATQLSNALTGLCNISQETTSDAPSGGVRQSSVSFAQAFRDFPTAEPGHTSNTHNQSWLDNLRRPSEEINTPLL